MQIAILSDTHMPRGERRLPPPCLDLLQQADLIIHAGDLMRLSVLRELERHGPVIAVHGNVDDAEVRAALPATRDLEIEDTRLAVVHDAGPRQGRVARLRDRFPNADAVIFGHSHLPLHERDADGFQIFNPGSPTERRRAPHKTMGIARVQGGKIAFELVVLD